MGGRGDRPIIIHPTGFWTGYHHRESLIHQRQGRLSDPLTKPAERTDGHCVTANLLGQCLSLGTCFDRQFPQIPESGKAMKT